MSDDPGRFSLIADQTDQSERPHWSTARSADGPRPSKAAIVTALNLVTEPVFFVAEDLRIVDANAAAVRSSGYPRSELLGTCFSQVVRLRGRRLESVFAQVIADASQCDTLRARHASKDGRRSAVKLQLECIDSDGEPLVVAIVKRLGAHGSVGGLPHAREHDYLTHLPARAAFTSRLRRAERRARRQQVGFAVLFIDVDRFKQVNDTLGHRVGDLVLKTFGRRLRASVRPGDFVARYGGDEFVALVENVSGEAEVHRIAERIRQDLHAPIDTPGGPIQVSASVGMAIGHAAASADDVVDQADRAMYQAKRSAE